MGFKPQLRFDSKQQIFDILIVQPTKFGYKFSKGAVRFS